MRDYNLRNELGESIYEKLIAILDSRYPGDRKLSAREAAKVIGSSHQAVFQSVKAYGLTFPVSKEDLIDMYSKSSIMFGVKRKLK